MTDALKDWERKFDKLDCSVKNHGGDECCFEGYGGIFRERIKSFIRQALADERERCPTKIILENSAIKELGLEKDISRKIIKQIRADERRRCVEELKNKLLKKCCLNKKDGGTCDSDCVADITWVWLADAIQSLKEKND